MIAHLIIRLGSTGPLVCKWQELLKLKIDGTFGPVTLKATKDYQSMVGLTPDGIVGFQTWTKRIGQEGVELMGKWYDSTFGGSDADRNARAVVDRALPGLSEAQKQYLLAVARGEGYYGLGWKPGEGAGSHNWGAVQGQGPAGSFQHIDHHADGTEYHTAFKAYNNDEEGAADMARILFHPNLTATLNTTRSLRKAVFTQHSNGYFELDPEKYLAAVIKNYNELSNSLGWQKILSEMGGATGAGIALLAFAAGLGYYLKQKFWS